MSTRKNITPDTLRGHLAVPERIPLDLLTEAFPRGADGTGGWWANLTWSHLEKAAQPSVREYGPEKRIAWLVHAADNQMSSKQLENYLREQKIIKARVTDDGEDEDRAHERIKEARQAVSHLEKCLFGDFGPLVKERVGRAVAQMGKPLAPPAPTTAMTLLIAMAEQLRQEGQDIDLSRMLARREPGKPLDVPAFLEFVAGELKRRPNPVTYSIETVKPPLE